MVTIKKRRFIFTLSENYFGYKFKWSDLFLPASYNGLRKVVTGQFFWGVKIDAQTAVLFLDKPIEEIYGNFYKSNKGDIKKAEAQGIQCYINNDRKAFVEFYNEFAKRRNFYTLDSQRLEEFSGEEFKYSYAVLNGELLVARSFMEDKETGIVRSLQSGTLLLNDHITARHIAQANKLLHYFCINYFKERGNREYDFGYWENLPGLLEFKQSFGAKPIDEFNYFTYAFILNMKLKNLVSYIKRKKQLI